MKYIIELEDEPYMKEDGVNYYTCKSARWYKLGETIINRLTPYTEPDRKVIEDEVWELANYMGRMSLTERDLCFGFPLPQEVTMNLTYEEAKSMFEKWMENENEIHVGDEVENASHKKGIVFNHYISPNNGLKYVRVLYMDDDGNLFISSWEKTDVCKTGRHFDSVEKLLEEMMED